MLLVRTVLRPSPIHGIGLFAAERIAAGAPVWRFVREFDRALPPDFPVADPDFLHRYAQQCPMTKCFVLCADFAKFMNFSPTPNVNVRAPLWDVSLTHDALRDIEAGEELTCDYRIGDTDPFVGFDPEAIPA